MCRVIRLHGWGENRLEEQLPKRSVVMLFEEHVPNERLRRTRHLKGWTQSELAERVGTDFETVSRWERGITLPSAYFRDRLCSVLDKTPPRTWADRRPP